jgi:hypothetical protein
VSINWISKTKGVDTIRIVENPLVYDGILLPAGTMCASDTLKIPVQVIDRPNVMFDTIVTGLRYDVGCAPGIAATNKFTYGFPLIATDSIAPGDVVPADSLPNRKINEDLDGLYIRYTVEKQNASGVFVSWGSFPKPNPDTLATCNHHRDSLSIAFGSYGTYRMTILDVSNHIAEKCSVDGLVTKAVDDHGTKKNQFILMIIDLPKRKDANHVKNNRQ